MNEYRAVSRKVASALVVAISVVLQAAVTATAYAGPNHDDFMQGFPPPPDKRVDKSNWFNGPYNRWGLQHVREITPTTEISRGDGTVYPLPSAPKPIGELPVTNLEGEKATITDWLTDSYTDGFLVLHKGKILSEVYMNSMTANSYHNFFSMSKSFVGNLAGILAGREQLDLSARVDSYVPEMAGSAYGDATVRQLLDMTIGINYVEDYDDPNSDVFRYSMGANAVPNPQGLTLYDVLPTFKKGGAHGETFKYVTANTDALGWVLQRASNRHLVELLTTEIWSKLGAERDAYVISDLNGTPFLGGGLNTTLRDAARFGLMMQQGGVIDGRRIVPEKFVNDIRESAFDTGIPGLHYRNQWWVYPDLNAFAAQGVAGQRIMIIPEHELVVVKLSSWPALSGYHPQGRAYDRRALLAIVKYIRQQ